MAQALHHHSHGHEHKHTHSHSGIGGPTRRDFLASLVSAAVIAPWALGQTQSPTPAETAERFRQMAEDYEKEGLADPFKGITADGKVESGLFAMSPSGVSTGPVRN